MLYTCERNMYKYVTYVPHRGTEGEFDQHCVWFHAAVTMGLSRGCPMWSQAGEIFCHVADPAVSLPIDNIHQNWCSVSQISQATNVRSGVLGLFVRNASQTQMHGWCVYIITGVSIFLYVITVYVINHV